MSTGIVTQGEILGRGAQLDWNQAKYVAKNAELFLLQISGDLGEARF